jgi:hypothetical protein
MESKLFCVSNWYDYALVRALSPQAAVHQRYSSKTFVLLDNLHVDEDTAVSAMCCEYSGFVEDCLEQCQHDMDRVLWLDMYPDTLRYQFSPRLTNPVE